MNYIAESIQTAALGAAAFVSSVVINDLATVGTDEPVQLSNIVALTVGILGSVCIGARVVNAMYQDMREPEEPYDQRRAVPQRWNPGPVRPGGLQPGVRARIHNNVMDNHNEYLKVWTKNRDTVPGEGYEA